MTGLTGQTPAFGQDRRANVAIVFALCAAILTICMGLAVDFSRTTSTRTEAQNALDTVVLAKAGNASYTTAQLSAMFSANFSTRGATLSSVSVTTDTSGLVTGTATVTVPMSFSGLVGYTRAQLTVTSKATPTSPAKYSSVTMTTKSAQGAFDKEIYVVTYDKNGTELTRQLAMSYDYTYSRNVGTKSYSPAIGNSIKINLTSYDLIAVEMVVYEDLTYTGQKTNPKKLNSKATNASSFIRTSGSCTDSTGETENWEDGGDSNFADFVANTTCVLVPNSADTLRITQ